MPWRRITEEVEECYVKWRRITEEVEECYVNCVLRAAGACLMVLGGGGIHFQLGAQKTRLLRSGLFTLFTISAFRFSRDPSAAPRPAFPFPCCFTL